ncbi:MAG: hypothetical protein DRR03_07200 [Gammaproteobacteria bacterium]|nr:MAG: hypothetical protein DRR03_07200 [Gammaproteobacteria bacterium]
MSAMHSLRLIPFTVAMLLAACGGGGGSSTPPPPPPVCTTPCGITLNWSANMEAGVNDIGGGYRIYYATAPNTALGQATLLTVAHDPASGQTPTTAALQLTAGTWYVRVTAFSTINTSGSDPSTELAVVVP